MRQVGDLLFPRLTTLFVCALCSQPLVIRLKKNKHLPPLESRIKPFHPLLTLQSRVKTFQPMDPLGSRPNFLCNARIKKKVSTNAFLSFLSILTVQLRAATFRGQRGGANCLFDHRMGSVFVKLPCAKACRRTERCFVSIPLYA